MKRLIPVLIIVVLTMSAFATGTGEEPGQSEVGSKVAIPDSFEYAVLPGRITEEPITLKMTRWGFTDIRPPAEEVWMWQRYEELTGIKVEWQEIPRTEANAKKNLLMAAGDLPDAFYNYLFTTDEIFSYGFQGLFIPLNDLIDNYGPALRRFFHEQPEVEKAITMADGSIYSLPHVRPGVLPNSLRFYLNENWLNRLGLEVPQTIDELTQVLMRFKEEDANGNGDPNDEYPYHFRTGLIASYEFQFLGSYGLGNRGQQANNQHIDLGPDGNVRFWPMDDRYRELWAQFNEWWENGLFHPEVFTGITQARWVADASSDLIGFFSWVQPNIIGAKVVDDFIGFSTLEGPHGDRKFTWLSPTVRATSAFMITNQNEYPEETIHWIDFFYSDEGTIFGAFGEEGVTFTRDTEGTVTLVDEIVNYEGGPQRGSFQKLEHNWGGNKPFKEPLEPIRLRAWGISPQDRFRLAEWNDYEGYLCEEYWPTFNPTIEESQELSAFTSDINTYIEEMRVKFITGELDIDSDDDWNIYLTTLKRMGVDRYIEIKQAQYDRYRGK